MKKAVVVILTLALVMSLCIAFVACDNDSDKQTASNSEVLGTAVAVATQFTTGMTAAEANDDANVNFNAGIDLSVEDNGLGFDSSTVMTGIGTFVKPALQYAVNNVKNVLGENGITVSKVDNDNTDYDEKYQITITHIDEETAEETVEKLALYIKLTSDNGSVEGKTAYTFSAKVMYIVESDKEDVEDKEFEITSFSGSATFDDIKNAMIFDLGAGAGNENASAFAGIKAYGTATGSVVVEMGAGAGITQTLGASVSLSVEVGKLADGKFGATVVAAGDVNFGTLGGMDFVATLNVYANNQDKAGEFVLNGTIEVTATTPSLGSLYQGGTYKGTATLTGKAVYDVDKDEAVLGLSGTLNFEKVEEENN